MKRINFKGQENQCHDNQAADQPGRNVIDKHLQVLSVVRDLQFYIHTTMILKE